MHRRRDRTVPGQVHAVGAAAPAGRAPGRRSQPAEQVPHRGGQPRLRGGQPDGRAQQVHREVGGEGDRRLQVVVHDRGKRPDRRGGGGGRRGRLGEGGAGPARPVGQPVHPQRGGPPGQVRAVGSGAPGARPLAELAPPGPPRGARGARFGQRSRRHAQHADGQPDRQPGGEVTGAGAGQVRLRREGRPLAEEADRGGAGHDAPGSRHVGPPDCCRVDRHRCPPGEVVAAAGEGAAGKEEVTDDGGRGPALRTPRPGRVTEPLPRPLATVDDPPPGPVTCRLHRAKPQIRRPIGGR